MLQLLHVPSTTTYLRSFVQLHAKLRKFVTLIPLHFSSSLLDIAISSVFIRVCTCARNCGFSTKPFFQFFFGSILHVIARSGFACEKNPFKPQKAKRLVFGDFGFVLRTLDGNNRNMNDSRCCNMKELDFYIAGIVTNDVHVSNACLSERHTINVVTLAFQLITHAHQQLILANYTQFLLSNCLIYSTLCSAMVQNSSCKGWKTQKSLKKYVICEILRLVAGSETF